MIPIRDVIPSRTFPGVVVAIVALNAVAFLYELSLSPREVALFMSTWGVVPARLDVVSVFTSMFLHGGWLHIIGNMWFLWIFGDNVEDRMGHGRFVVFYLLSGALAACAHAWSAPASVVPTIGASGAVAGVMGGYFVMYPQSRILTALPILPPIIMPIFEVPAVVFLGFWFLLELLSGVGASLLPAGTSMSGGIAFWAHVAGFAAGALLINVFKRPERVRVEWWNDRPQPPRRGPGQPDLY